MGVTLNRWHRWHHTAPDSCVVFVRCRCWWRCTSAYRSLVQCGARAFDWSCGLLRHKWRL